MAVCSLETMGIILDPAFLVPLPSGIGDLSICAFSAIKLVRFLLNSCVSVSESIVDQSICWWSRSIGNAKALSRR